MTIQRLSHASSHMYPHDVGRYVHYDTHVEVVGLIYDQLDLTQKQLERAQEQIRMLTEALTRR